MGQVMWLPIADREHRNGKGTHDHEIGLICKIGLTGTRYKMQNGRSSVMRCGSGTHCRSSTQVGSFISHSACVL